MLIHFELYLSLCDMINDEDEFVAVTIDAGTHNSTTLYLRIKVNVNGLLQYSVLILCQK